MVILCIRILPLFITGFSLTDWLQSKGYPYGTFLGEDVTSQLLEVLCLTGYLQTTQCGKADAIYQPNVKGWSKSKSFYTEF